MYFEFFIPLFFLVMKLGEKVRDLRRKANLTLEELAQATGSSKGYIWELENKDTNPSLDKLRKIANALHVNVTELISDEEPEDLTSNALFREINAMSEKDREMIKKIISAIKS